MRTYIKIMFLMTCVLYIAACGRAGAPEKPIEMDNAPLAEDETNNVQTAPERRFILDKLLN